VAQARAGHTDRVYGMDARWSPEAFKVSRVERRQDAREVVREIEG